MKYFYTLVLLAFLGNASAASFDCTKATTPQEKAVCGSTTLSALDEKLADAYKNARTASQDPAKLKSEQVEWIKEARKCQSDTSCIERLYTARINELNPQPVKPTPEPVVAPSAVSASTVEQPASASAPQHTASAMEAAPAAPVASAAAPVPAPVASEAKVVNVESKPSIFSDPVYQRYALIAGGGILALIAAYFIIKFLISLAKKTATKASSAARAGVSKLAEESAKMKATLEQKGKNLSEHAALKASEVSELAVSRAKAVMDAHGDRIKTNQGLKSRISDTGGLAMNNGEQHSNTKQESIEELKKLSELLFRYSKNQCFNLVEPLNRDGALEYSNAISSTDAALHLDDAINFSDSISVIYDEIDRLIKIDTDIVDLSTRVSDGLKKYQSNIYANFSAATDDICDLTKTKEEKSLLIQGIVRTTLLASLDLTNTEYNWNISQAAIAYKRLTDSFKEITLNIQKLDPNLWTELNKIWNVVEFSESDSCEQLNSMNNEIFNKLEALVVSTTIQKMSADNKLAKFYLNKNLRIGLWLGITLCAAIPFWKISNDYYRQSGFSLFAIILYAALCFGPVYWFFNKKILKRRCPNCLALFSTDTPSQDLLGSQDITIGTIDVEAGKVHSASGHHIATLTEKRENKTTISTYKYYHCCDQCNFVWNTVDSNMALIGHVGNRV